MNLGVAKRLWYCAVFATFGAVYAQVHVHEEQPMPAPARELRSLELVGADREFVGRFEAGKSAKRTLKFRNRLTVPVRVEVQSKTCGCLSASFDTSPVAPGGTTTLVLQAVVPAQLGEQAQSAGFRCVWSEGGAERSEEGRAGLRYMALVEYSVFPPTLTLPGVVGEEATVAVVVRALSGSDVPPETDPPVCSLPGWKVEEVRDDRVGALARMYRVHGPISKQETIDGIVTWTTRNPAQPTITVPIRVQGLTPYRAFPGGAWFTGTAPLRDGERIITLTARTRTSAGPARVRLSEAATAVGAGLTRDGRVRIRFAPQPDTPPVGSVRVRVEAEDGTLLTDIPVVWYTLDAAPAGDKP